MLPPLLVLIIVIVIISTVVGTVAKLLNNLNEGQGANAARLRPPGAAGGPRQPASDVDRFLAEIDRLRRKTAEPPPPAPPSPPPPERKPERSRPRLADDFPDPTKEAREDRGLTAAPADLPVAQVVPAAGAPAPPPGAAGMPSPRGTPRYGSRPRSTARPTFAKNLTALLTSSQGLAIAVVLPEILGAPKCKRGQARARVARYVPRPGGGSQPPGGATT
jgi:hypothetical protein